VLVSSNNIDKIPELKEFVYQNKNSGGMGKKNDGVTN
jgi:hypothetical protein